MKAVKPWVAVLQGAALGKQVVQTLAGFFFVAEHHGGRGAQALVVGGFHHVQPLFCRAFVG